MANHFLLVLVGLATTISAKYTKRTFDHPPRPSPKHTKPEITTQEHHKEILKSFPKKFDWCEQGFCGPSWNQHIPQYCGACFLHGSLSAYQDRALIRGVSVELSRQAYLNCAPGRNSSEGCNGGEPGSVFQYMHDYGIPDESCMPYNATDNTKWGLPDDPTTECPAIGECMNCMYINGAIPPRTECWPVTKFTKYRAKKWGNIKGELAMMKEIQARGPITCGISCPAGFAYDYRSGVFEDKTNERDIDHDIEVVGWGEEDGVKYWHIRNSWGTYWGVNGYAKVIRGKDNLCIESDCTWVEPDLSEVKLVSQTHPKYGGSHYGLVDLKAPGSKGGDDMATLNEASPDQSVFSSAANGTFSFLLVLLAVLCILAVAVWVSASHKRQLSSSLSAAAGSVGLVSISSAGNNSHQYRPVV